jgi:acyl-coenzyme A synthetase/AMP-(fatty) acid ligase
MQGGSRIAGPVAVTTAICNSDGLGQSRHMFSHVPASASLVDARTGETFDRAGLATAIASRVPALRALDVAKGDRVAVAHGSPVGLLIDLFAIWRIGAMAVLLSKNITAGERANVVATVRPALWIGTVNDGLVPHLPPAEATADGSGASSISEFDDADLDAPALVLMTSGTTATPKGVVHSRRSLAARIALNIAHIPHIALAEALTLLPMHFGHGLIGNCLTPLFAGARLHLMPDPGPVGLARLGPLIDAHGITFLSSVPSLWRVAMKTSPRPERRSLRRVHVGSAPLSVELWRAIMDWTGTDHVVNMYGITETANWIGGHNAAEAPPADGLVGRIWGGAIRVIDAEGALADRGRGEVAVATPGLMQGYLDQPGLTDAAIRGGWFLTGDTGEIDAEGRLSIVGRLKHEINRGGIKIPAEEIDLLLERHPDVVEACAFAQPDLISGETIAVAVVLRSGANVDAAALRSWCRGQIRAEAVPEHIAILDELPRNERGKLDRRRTAEAFQTKRSVAAE